MAKGKKRETYSGWIAGKNRKEFRNYTFEIPKSVLIIAGIVIFLLIILR